MGLGLARRLPHGVAWPLLKVRDLLEDSAVRRSPFYRRYTPPLGYAASNRRVSVSRDHRFIYFRVQKAANSTIAVTLHEAVGGAPIPHTMEGAAFAKAAFGKPSDLTADEAAQLSDYFKFTFVRNPYTRFVSGYLGVKRGGNPMYRRRVAAVTGKGETAYSTFDFLDYLEAGGLMEDPHWARQSDIVFMPTSELDFVGKIETIDRDLDYVTTRISGRSRPIRTIAPNAAIGAATQLTNVLTRETAKRVLSLYEPDFAAFGYSTRPPLPE